MGHNIYTLVSSLLEGNVFGEDALLEGGAFGEDGFLVLFWWCFVCCYKD
jgi:hypothetical protein